MCIRDRCRAALSSGRAAWPEEVTFDISCRWRAAMPANSMKQLDDQQLIEQKKLLSKDVVWNSDGDLFQNLAESPGSVALAQNLQLPFRHLIIETRVRGG